MRPAALRTLRLTLALALVAGCATLWLWFLRWAGSLLAGWL